MSLELVKLQILATTVIDLFRAVGNLMPSLIIIIIIIIISRFV